MQFLKRRPALKLLPFLILGILIGEYFPQFNFMLIPVFVMSFLGIFSRFQTISILFCIISIGENNKFNHPSQKIVNRWKNEGVDINRTDIHGAITVVSNGQFLWIYTEARM